MPITDNGLTTIISQLQIGQDPSNAVVLKAVNGNLSIRDVGDSTAADLTLDDLTVDDITGDVISSTAQGTVGAATVSLSTTGDGRDFTTVLTLTDFVVGSPGGAAANKGIGNKVFTFPAGAHIHFATYMSIGLTGAGTAATPDVGIGSVVASGAVAVLGGTATFEDYITGQTAADITGTATVKTSVATAGALTGISINEAGSVKDVFLNVASAWSADNTGNLTATGTITLRWTKLS